MRRSSYRESRKLRWTSALLALGFLGAVVYLQSPWYVAALFIPIAISYIAFSRLSQKIGELELAEEGQRTAKDYLELRVEARTAELAKVTEELELSRRRIVGTQEKLRKAVVQQLHGPVQNRLILVAHRLHIAQETLESDSAESAKQISIAEDLLRTITQDELRSVMRRLHPSLIQMSLEASLRSLAEEFESSFRVEIHASGREQLWHAGMPEELRLAIYRVAEEALSNVLKHSAATEVDLHLLDRTAEDDAVALEVRDNGHGFDVKTTGPGFGILTMQDYCGAAGGRLVVESKPGGGTKISASFPLSPVL